MQDASYSPEVFVPTYRVRRFVDDLESLADSWNALAVSYRLAPSGFWARAMDDDRVQAATTLEDAATALVSAIQRFKEAP